MTNTRDAYGLQRFIAAQDGVFERVLAELRAGAKRSHWMWFVFPQLRGLGHSTTARYFGIESLAEAVAYWQHPMLGPRLKDCTALVLAVRDRTALEIFGPPDDLKFCSSMTLFEQAAPDESAFGRAIDKYYAGMRDTQTLQLLQRRP